MNAVVREVGAVAAGVAVLVLTVTVSLAVLMGVGGVLPGAPPPGWFLGASALLSGICGVFGGAVCAWLAGRAHPRTTPALAVVVGLAGAWVAAHPDPTRPAAYGWATVVLAVLGVLGGALFWTRARRA